MKTKTKDRGESKSKVKNFFKSMLSGIDKVFFPRNIKCLVCGRDLPKKQEIEFCEKCNSKLERIESNFCARCGTKLIGEEKFCLNCQNNQLDFDVARCVFVFSGKVKDLIHNFKYNNRPYMSSSLANCMYELFTKLNWPVDFVIPVPSSKETLKARGYNQAELLASDFCSKSGLELREDILKKTKHTKQQASLNFNERKQNLDGSFDVDLSFRSTLRGKTILLIDDVITTGSTASECAKILKKRGAERVLVLAVARAYHEIPVQNNLENAKSFV